METLGKRDFNWSSKKKCLPLDGYSKNQAHSKRGTSILQRHVQRSSQNQRQHYSCSLLIDHLCFLQVQSLNNKSVTWPRDHLKHLRQDNSVIRHRKAQWQLKTTNFPNGCLVTARPVSKTVKSLGDNLWIEADKTAWHWVYTKCLRSFNSSWPQASCRILPIF